jgi:hypothetical protein
MLLHFVRGASFKTYFTLAVRDHHSVQLADEGFQELHGKGTAWKCEITTVLCRNSLWRPLETVMRPGRSAMLEAGNFLGGLDLTLLGPSCT